MPGGGPGPEMPGPPPRVAELGAKLDALEDVAADLERLVLGRLDERLGRLQAVADGIGVRLQGAVGSRMAALDDRAGKIAGKLVKNLDKKLGQAYTYAFPYGFVYPTTDQALYGITSGDIFGSAGLSPPPPAPDLGVPDAVGTAVNSTPLPPPPDATGVTNPLGPGGSPGTLNPGYQPPPGPFGSPGTLNPGYQPPVTPDPGFPPPTPPGGGTGGPQCPPDTHWIPEVGMCGNLTGGVTTTFPPAKECCCCGGCSQSKPWDNCPPGYHWEPDPDPAGGDSTLTGTKPPPDLKGVRGPVEECSPPVLAGWQPVRGTVPPHRAPDGCTYELPWQSDPAGQVDPTWQSVTVGGCHFRPPVPQPITFYYPAGHRLYMRSADWSMMSGSCPPPGYADFTLLMQLYGSQNPPPGGGGGGPGGGGPGGAGGPGGKCVKDPVGPAACNVPAKPECGGPGMPKLPAMVLGDSEYCKFIADQIDKFQENPAKLADLIKKTLGDKKPDSTGLSVLRALVGVDDPLIPGLINGLGEWLGKFVERTAADMGPGLAGFVQVTLQRAVMRFVDHWTGAVPRQLLNEIDQVSNTILQSEIPSVPEANRAYLADEINKDVWECWVKANGAFAKEQERVYHGDRQRLNTRETVLSRLREWITPERYQKLMRENGVLEDEDREEIARMANYWPTYTDLITWLRKDVFDDKIVARFKLDEDFERKYTERAEKFGNGAGLDAELMRYHWRAHWRPVGVTRILEAFHRLRPDKVPPNVAVTLEDVTTALKQEDIPPYWIDRFVALSYAKPTRVDVRRMWELHLIEEEELYQRTLDLGYSPEDAKLLVEYWKVDRRQKELKKNGLPTGRALVNGYARGEITARELEGIALELSYYPEQPGEIIAAAELARDMATRKNAIGAVKRRFTRGLIGASEAAAELARVGIDGDEIQSLLEWWEQVIAYRGKQATAAELCKWRKLHLITAAEQMAALLRLGYESWAADLIVKACGLELVQAETKAGQKAQAQTQKAAQKAAQSEAAKMKAATRRRRINTPASPTGSGAGGAGP